MSKTKTIEIDNHLVTVLHELGFSKKLYEFYLVNYQNDPLKIQDVVKRSEYDSAEVIKLVNELSDRHLIRKISDKPFIFQILPPYNLFLTQFEKYDNYLKSTHRSAINQINGLNQKRQRKQSEMEGLRQIEDDFTLILEKINNQFNDQKDALTKLIKTSLFQDTAIQNLERVRKKAIDKVGDQLKELPGYFENLEGKISTNLEKLHLGVITRTLNEMVQKVVRNEAKNIMVSLENEYLNNLNVMINESIQEFKLMPVKGDKMILQVKDNFFDVQKKLEDVFEKTKNDIQKASVGPIIELLSDQEEYLKSIRGIFDDIFMKSEQKADLNLTLMQALADTAQELPSVGSPALATKKRKVKLDAPLAKIEPKFRPIEKIRPAPKRRRSSKTKFRSIPKGQSKKLVGTSGETVGDIYKQIDFIENGLTSSSPETLIGALDQLKDLIRRVVGYTKVLRYIENWEETLRREKNLGTKQQKMLVSQLHSWKSQIK